MKSKNGERTSKEPVMASKRRHKSTRHLAAQGLKQIPSKSKAC